MQTLTKIHILLLLMLSFICSTCITQQTPTSFCGKIRIQTPNSTEPYPLSTMILCKSKKLYFRTSLGLFPMSSINYTSKILTISHSSCSSSRHYVSPSLLSAGFPSPPPKPNSLLLFNCSNQRYFMPAFINNHTCLHGCQASSSSCLLADDVTKLNMSFHPKDMNCSHYSRVYKRSLNDDDNQQGYELGTRISFEVPDHVPDICNECEKPHGNCGVGLRCICHPKECKDKVFSEGISMNFTSNTLSSLVPLIVFVISFLMQEM